MDILIVLLLIALAVYVVGAFTRYRGSVDMTAIGFALVCFTMLIGWDLI